MKTMLLGNAPTMGVLTGFAYPSVVAPQVTSGGLNPLFVQEQLVALRGVRSESSLSPGQRVLFGGAVKSAGMTLGDKKEGVGGVGATTPIKKLSDDELIAIKRQYSAWVREHPGVHGIGVGGGVIRVYHTANTPQATLDEIKERLNAAGAKVVFVSGEAPGTLISREELQRIKLKHFDDVTGKNGVWSVRVGEGKLSIVVGDDLEQATRAELTELFARDGVAIEFVNTPEGVPFDQRAIDFVEANYAWLSQQGKRYKVSGAFVGFEHVEVMTEKDVPESFKRKVRAKFAEIGYDVAFRKSGGFVAQCY